MEKYYALAMLLVIVPFQAWFIYFLYKTATKNIPKWAKIVLSIIFIVQLSLIVLNITNLYEYFS
jgi:hypothetical protein